VTVIRRRAARKVPVSKFGDNLLNCMLMFDFCKDFTATRKVNGIDIQLLQEISIEE
jgi:hypothetical protein